MISGCQWQIPLPRRLYTNPPSSFPPPDSSSVLSPSLPPAATPSPGITRGSAETISLVLAAICEFTHLEYLHLSSPLSHDLVEFPHHKIPRFALTRLALSNCELRDVDLTWPGSSSLSSLVSFRLDEVFGISGEGLDSFLSLRGSTLRELRISLCDANIWGPNTPLLPSTYDLALSSLSSLTRVVPRGPSFSHLLLHNINPSLSSSLHHFHLHGVLGGLDESDLLAFVPRCDALEAVSSTDLLLPHMTTGESREVFSELELYVAERGISFNGQRFRMVDLEEVDAEYAASGLGSVKL